MKYAGELGNNDNMTIEDLIINFSVARVEGARMGQGCKQEINCESQDGGRKSKASYAALCKYSTGEYKVHSTNQY